MGQYNRKTYNLFLAHFWYKIYCPCSSFHPYGEKHRCLLATHMHLETDIIIILIFLLRPLKKNIFNPQMISCWSLNTTCTNFAMALAANITSMCCMVQHFHYAILPHTNPLSLAMNLVSAVHFMLYVSDLQSTSSKLGVHSVLRNKNWKAFKLLTSMKANYWNQVIHSLHVSKVHTGPRLLMASLHFTPWNHHT